MKRVICVKRKWVTVQTAISPPKRLPEYDKVYTIGKMEYFHRWDTWGITLKELEPDQFFELDAFLPWDGLDMSFPEWVESTILQEAVYEDTIKQQQL